MRGDVFASLPSRIVPLEVIETRVLSVEEHDKDRGQILSRVYTVGRRPKGLLLIRPATRARSSSNASA